VPLGPQPPRTERGGGRATTSQPGDKIHHEFAAQAAGFNPPLRQGQGTRAPSLATRAPLSRLKQEMGRMKLVLVLRERKRGKVGAPVGMRCRPLQATRVRN
jgi:hypothetical protein